MQANLFKCTACGKSKPRTAEYFHCNKKSADGFLKVCKKCRNLMIRNYHRRGRNIEVYNLKCHGKIEGAARNNAWNINRIRIQKRLGIFTEKGKDA